MVKKLVLLVWFMLVVTSFSYAQVEKGDSEILFSGTFMSIVGIENYSSMNASVNLSYGYFLTKNLEIGIGPSLTYSRSEQTYTNYDYFGGSSEEKSVNENKNLSGTVFFNLNFSTSSKTVPYIAGQWYQTDFNPENGEFSDYSYANIGFGIRNFFNEYVALNTSVNYGFSLAKEAEGGVLLILTGVSVIL